MPNLLLSEIGKAHAKTNFRYTGSTSIALSRASRNVFCQEADRLALSTESKRKAVWLKQIEFGKICPFLTETRRTRTRGIKAGQFCD